MQEHIESRSHKQLSLRQLASRNFMLSLFLFVVLIAIIVMASLRDRQSMDMLADVYNDQFRVEQFKATLSDIMLPLNDFTMTAESSNFTRIRKAISAYKTSYDSIKSIRYLSDQDNVALNQVNTLMNEVMTMASDVADKKIPGSQAAQVTLLAQNLVLAAQKKLESIVQGMEKKLSSSQAERRQKADMQLYILLGFIVFVVLLLEFLNRRLLRQAQTVSRVSSNVAESAGDIIMVNKMQASATGQQSRFMEKVIKGLELIAESGSEISAAIGGLEKNTGIIHSFAKGGGSEVKDCMAAMDKVRENMEAMAELDQTLAQKNSQILNALQQIQDVADEAHLLALNTSIDVGGQSISSITNEVQRMADQIRESCEEMRMTVLHMSGASSQVAGGSLESLEQSLELSRHLVVILSRIETISEKNVQTTSVISRVTERQNERNQKILQALQHISELLHISDNKVQEYSDASARLSKASESLQHLS